MFAQGMTLLQAKSFSWRVNGAQEGLFPLLQLLPLALLLSGWLGERAREQDAVWVSVSAKCGHMTRGDGPHVG